MSDPVSNEDIEDVLSSIRRLVSDEPIKGMPRRKTAKPEAKSDNVERFVLTPAFRVSGDEATVEPATSELPPEPPVSGRLEPQQTEKDLAPYQSDDEWSAPKPETDLRSDTDQPDDIADRLFRRSADPSAPPEEPQEKTLRRVIAEPIAVEPAPFIEVEDPYESDQAEDTAELDVEALFAEHTDADEELVPLISDDAAAVPSEAMSGKTTLETRIAELEAALQNSAQEWEPDGSEQELTDEIRPLAFEQSSEEDGLAEAIAAVAKEVATQAPSPDEEAEALNVPDAPKQAALGDRAPIETLYAGEPSNASYAPQDAGETEDDQQPVIDDKIVEWHDVEADHDEPEEAGFYHVPGEPYETASNGPPNHSADAPQATSIAAAQAAARSDLEADLFANDEPAMLDEEALQELVGDLVRQELQGVLGERITRNVRRLVRREIKRALAMRDFE